jgi:hypothetical protein
VTVFNVGILGLFEALLETRIVRCEQLSVVLFDDDPAHRRRLAENCNEEAKLGTRAKTRKAAKRSL